MKTSIQVDPQVIKNSALRSSSQANQKPSFVRQLGKIRTRSVKPVDGLFVPNSNTTPGSQL